MGRWLPTRGRGLKDRVIPFVKPLAYNQSKDLRHLNRPYPNKCQLLE